VTTYRLITHRLLGEFAVRVEDGTITGIVAVSLHFACDPDGRLPDLLYDDLDAALYRVRHHPEQFMPFEAWLGEREGP
jgi:hypothetical protein